MKVKLGWFVNYVLSEYMLNAALDAGADNWTVMSSFPNYTALLRSIKERNPEADILVRYWRPTPWLLHSPSEDAAEFFVQHYVYHQPYTRMVMPLNEPQLETPGCDPNVAESVGAMWVKLNDWLLEWIAAFRKLAPDAIIVFPSPAPGVFWDDDRGTWGVRGLSLCWDSLRACNLIGQNVYWQGDGYGLYEDEDLFALRYRRTVEYTGKKVWITEYNSDVGAADWHYQMGDFLTAVELDSSVVGATCFLLQGHDGQFGCHDVSRVPDIEDKMRYIRSQIERNVLWAKGFETTIRHRAWDHRAIAFNPEAALAAFARQHNLGSPETAEFDVVVENQWYRAQGFEQGIIYCVLGDWSNVEGPLSW